MGRTSSARERLLDAACALLHGQGYSGVGVAEICARAEVRKGSFYHFFESKQALAVAAVDVHWRDRRAGWSARLHGPGPALLRLRTLFQDQVEAQRRDRESGGAVNGCLLGNLAAELGTRDDRVRARLAEIFDEQIALIEAALREAAAEGDIPPHRATRFTARALVAQLEGMVLLAKAADSPAVLDDLWSQALLLLQAADVE